MTRTKTILALDPGTRNLGFAVLRGKRILASGTHRFPRLRFRSRIPEIRPLMRNWVEMFRPSVVVLEAAPKNRQANLDGVYRSARRIAAFCRRQGIPVVRYPAQTVRKGLLGDGWANKREAALAVCERFPELRIYLRQDRQWKERHWLNMFDAVALALHHQAVAA